MVAFAVKSTAQVPLEYEGQVPPLLPKVAYVIEVIVHPVRGQDNAQ